MLKKFFKGWIRENIFGDSKLDSGAYLLFYGLIPIIVTMVSLSVESLEASALVYCYMSILISSLNCVYDSANRWKSGVKSIVNTKLFIMMGSNVVVIAYCLVEIFYMLITRTVNGRPDGWLFTYLVTVVIAVIDTISCFLSEIAIKSCLEGDE